MKYLLKQFDLLQAELEDICVNDVSTWYPGMLQRLEDITKLRKDESSTKMSTRKSKEPVGETPADNSTKDLKLGLVTMISKKSKAIKKTPGEAYFTKLYRKHPQVFDEIKRLREVVKAADQEKYAANERLKTLLGSGAVFLDIESA